MSDRDPPAESELPQNPLRAPPGASPGTLIADPEAPAPRLRVLAYRTDGFEECAVAAPHEVRRWLDDWDVTWVNVDGLGDAEVIRSLGEIFGLHPLTLEDVLHVQQRPKVEDYDSYLFTVGRMLADGESLETEQLSIVLGEKFVLTFQESAGDCFDIVRERIRKASTRMRRFGPDYLAYALLDATIDAYFPLSERLGDRLEELEDEVLGGSGHDDMGEVYQIKRELNHLRRVLRPQRVAINALIRDETPLVRPETHVFLRDCYDHTSQLIELVDGFRELASDLVALELSMASNRMNEVMRFLTTISTIFIPMTFIAGVYGMNFDRGAAPWSMPELGWVWGYPSCLLLMVLTGGGLFMYFRLKRWL